MQRIWHLQNNWQSLCKPLRWGTRNYPGLQLTKLHYLLFHCVDTWRPSGLKSRDLRDITALPLEHFIPNMKAANNNHEWEVSHRPIWIERSAHVIGKEVSSKAPMPFCQVHRHPKNPLSLGQESKTPRERGVRVAESGTREGLFQGNATAFSFCVSTAEAIE